MYRRFQGNVSQPEISACYTHNPHYDRNFYSFSCSFDWVKKFSLLSAYTKEINDIYTAFLLKWGLVYTRVFDLSVYANSVPLNHN